MSCAAACEAAAIVAERICSRLVEDSAVGSVAALEELNLTLRKLDADIETLRQVDDPEVFEAIVLEQVHTLRAMNLKLATNDEHSLAIIEGTMAAEDQPVAGVTESIHAGLQRFTVYWVVEGASDHVDVVWRPNSSSAWERKHRFDAPGRIDLELAAGEVRLIFSSHEIGRHAIADVCRVPPRTGPVEYEKHTRH